MRSTRLQQMLLVLSGALLFASIVFGAQRLINSDSASTLLLAEDLLRSHSLISNNWFYVSDALGLDGVVQVAMLAVALFGVTPQAFVCMALLSAMICFASAFALSRALQASRNAAVTAGLVIVAGPSLIYQDLVIGLGIAMQIALVLGVLACSVRYAFQARSRAFLLCTFALLTLMVGSSPKKAAAYIVVPMIIAATTALLGDLRSRLLDPAIRRRVLVLMAAAIVAMLLGVMAHRQLMQGVSVDNSYAKLHIDLSWAGIRHNVQVIVPLIARFAGQHNAAFPTFAMVAAPLALLVLLVAPLLPGRWSTLLASAQGFVWLCALAGFGMVCAYLLVYPDIKKYYGIYYAIVPVACGVCAAAGSLDTTGRDVRGWLQRGAWIVLLVLGAINSAYLLFAFPSDYFGIGIRQQSTHAERVALVHWLRARHLRFGYAHYWDANAITVLSGGEIRAVSAVIQVRSTRMERHRWLNTRTAVDYRPHTEEPWFIVQLTRRHVPLPLVCGGADSVSVLPGYEVYLYTQPKPACFEKHKTR